jgi:transposase
MSMKETQPKRVKRQYDEAFRRNAVALVESSGRSLKVIATELGVSHWNLRDWTKRHGRNRPRPGGDARRDAAGDDASAPGK